MSHASEPRPRHAALLCLAAGFVDAFGYFRLGEVFTANMTGNTVLLSIALARADWAKALVFVETLAAFVLGAFAAALLGRRLRQNFAALLVSAAVLVGTSLGDLPTRVALVALAFAMGLQGGSITTFAGQRVQTVVLTSALVRLAESTVARIWPAPAEAPARSGTVGLFALVWICYGAGAASAVVTGDIIRWPLALPALLLVVTALELLWRRVSGR
jgi:uncharacterized membrane protein YoaK (UPF0700 family)